MWEINDFFTYLKYEGSPNKMKYFYVHLTEHVQDLSVGN
jgi:hypothetical protein